MAWVSKFLFATLLFTNCLLSFAEEQPELSWPVKKIGRIDAYPAPGEMAVTLRKDGDAWKVDMEASIYRPEVEQIWFARDSQSGQIVVMARTPNQHDRSSSGMCTYGPSAGSNDRSIAGYTECNSNFFRCEASAGNVLRILPALVTGKSNCYPEFDPAAVKAALKSANVNEWLQTYKADRKLKSYRSRFEGIRSSNDADGFIRAYAQFDPDGLVEQARQKKDTLLASEAQAARQLTAEQERIAAEQEEINAEKRLKEEAQAKRNLEVQKLEQERVRLAEELRQKKISEFRKRLALGSDTFCGPVIAIRGPMVQIAVNAPLPGYSAEPWLKMEDIYPAEMASCKNLNGRLMPLFFTL